jgi:hypothetical protein
MSIATDVILDDKFRQWTGNKDLVQARISIYEKIRDIPYAVLPDLINAERYVDILKFGRGSCTPKHFLLGNMFQRLGLLVLYAVYPFRWGDRAEVLDDYPQQVRELSRDLPMSHHLACKVEIDGRLVLVDATLDLPLANAELPVNQKWDGFSDTLLPMTPCGEEEVFHPSEAHLMHARYDEKSLAFYDELNACLEMVRHLEQG